MIRKNYANNITQELLPLVSKGYTTAWDRYFISGIVQEYKPEKVLEVGVASGASSIIILDALQGRGKLYSHDYFSSMPKVDKPIGYLMDKVPHLKSNWTLRTGGMCCNYLDEFCSDGKKFDLCFLDTAHKNPGEFLDILQILPYMNKGGIIILHDITLHALKAGDSPTCCILFSALKGQKILPEGDFFVNIGAVILDDDIMDNVFDIFNCLRLPWEYTISKEDITAVRKCFALHYPKEMLQLFDSFCNLKQAVSNPRRCQLFRLLNAIKNNICV